MSRKRRQLGKVMLIICEGENTEPLYFEHLKSIALREGIWAEIDIRPEPKLEEPEKETHHKSKRAKRQFQRAESSEIENRLLAELRALDLEKEYDNYKIVPLRYVKEAQMELENYDEVWAVFDKNGHPGHAKAFELASEIINGKQVNIAFSSVSFEHWILLHFEKNDSFFPKSECKSQEDKKKTLACGTGVHSEDCYGSNCVVGKIRTNSYLPDYGKNRKDNVLSNALKTLNNPILLENVFENAAWLRHQMQRQLTAQQDKIYELNPYTDVDNIVKSILNISKKHQFATIGVHANFDNFAIKVDFDKNNIYILITNLSATAIIFNQNNINEKCYLADKQLLTIRENIVIEPNTTNVLEISFQIPIQEEKLYFCINQTVVVFV